MTTEEILGKIDKAISNLLDNDLSILRRRLQERILSSHLTDYLRPLFEDYDVDPEYNGDIDKPNDRKALDIAKGRMVEIGYRPNKNNRYRLSPDIIIHKRETNQNNLVVIEIKKDISSNKDKEYDLIKLEHLTLNYLGNHYNYKLGVAIIFNTGENAGTYSKVCFQNGKREKTIE